MFRFSNAADAPLPSRYDVAVGIAAILLTLAIFYIDAFTALTSAIAVLYVIALLLASEILTRKGILIATTGCAALAIVSFMIAHGLAVDLGVLLRLIVSLAAIVITSALLLRNEASRGKLIASNEQIKDSESRFRWIFEQSRVALWERDYSAVRAFLMALKAQGVTSIRDHVKAHPDVISACLALIRTVAANDAARELLGDVGTGGKARARRFHILPNDAAFLDLIEAIFDERQHFEGKGNLIATDGQTRLVLVSMRLPDDPAKFDRVIVGMVDITERELTQKALLEAQAELTRASRAATVGALSASLAHELNQPLGALVVNAQTMLRWINREPPDLEAIKRSADRMIRDSQRASDIIHNTRTMLSQGLRLPDTVDLPQLIQETLALMEHDLAKEAVQVEFAYVTATKEIQAVRIELQQVLINLITNAIQAMSTSEDPQRKLLISAREDDDGFVRLSVRDFGPGIQDEVMARLFAPFFTTKSKGLGMGLSICRSILELRGGDLVARNHQDGGAIFEMIMPIGECTNV
ncbi:sensor histidine kinase [Labrys monachus]|uniref:histidine kinase n=1 Tax=Labrys monachus TaxID=217067 RepID=A0ABU0F8F3_9HYPH|nr:ATP-binding protein [Labrys monachus]MDQ0390895.1 signal transduction histidine kinase [Labrys monachus]